MVKITIPTKSGMKNFCVDYMAFLLVFTGFMIYYMVVPMCSATQVSWLVSASIHVHYKWANQEFVAYMFMATLASSAAIIPQYLYHKMIFKVRVFMHKNGI